METYSDAHGNSGIRAFEIRVDSILIRFEDGHEYLYSNERPGRVHVEKMKRLAHEGQGLNTYINQHVRKRFAKQVK